LWKKKMKKSSFINLLARTNFKIKFFLVRAKNLMQLIKSQF